MKTKRDIAAQRSRLTHLDEDGRLSMVDVGSKEITRREAIARGTVRMSRATLVKVIDEALPKGDVFTVAKIAAIFAAKSTSALIPLTHPLAVSFVDVTFDTDLEGGTVEVRAIVRCDGKTGVEIEAMTACSVACLTIYDMCKSVERGIVIESIQLLEKSGGKSGTYRR